MEVFFKCKSCEAPLDDLVSRSMNGLVECPYCRSVYTVPKKETSPEALAFLRQGEHDLDTCKFDDAYTAYQKAAEIDKEEPEAFFGMALSEFRVQYLKDETADPPRLQPICHEISEKSFSANRNYLRAVELGSKEQKRAYRAKAAEIDEIRDQFNELKEDGVKYDCFLCVKVSDENGGTTQDSHDALRLYHHLKGRGFHPFYSEEEIGSRAGSDYEALILYALYRSECMLLICYDEDYLQTKWVRNEYTRFMAMIANEEKERDAITFVFKGKPVERLPGKSGKIQGIDLGKPDAYTRIDSFVESHTPEARAQREAEKALKKQEEDAMRRQLDAVTKLLEESERRRKEEEEARKKQEEENRLAAQKRAEEEAERRRADEEARNREREEMREWYNRMKREVASSPAAPAADALPRLEEGVSYSVVLKDIGDNKIAVINTMRGLKANLSLADAKKLVEGMGVMLENLTPEAARHAYELLKKAGATVELVPLGGSQKSAAVSSAQPGASYSVVLKAFPDYKKVAVIKAVREFNDLGLVGTKKLVEGLGVMKDNLTRAEADSICAVLTEAGATAEVVPMSQTAQPTAVRQAEAPKISEEERAYLAQFEIENGVLKKYKGAGGNVVIPAAVTEIGAKAFSESGLTSVSIPRSVTAIGTEAFKSCKKLKTITVPSSVKSIGAHVFSYCNELERVSLPEGITAIGPDMFLFCSALKSIQLPRSLTAIHGAAFAYSGLTGIDIPQGVTTIGSDAFKGCDKLTRIVLPPSVEKIERDAFNGCKALTEIAIPSGVTAIGLGAFSGCGELKKLSIPQGVTTIGMGMFAYCRELAEIDIPQGVTSIGSEAFKECKALTSIVIPGGIKTIGDNTFYHCDSLENVVIPESVTSIGKAAFYNCVGLKSINIPESVTSIGESAFCYCTGLTSVRVPQGITALADDVFSTCRNLASVFIPQSVTSVGNRAFQDCRSLTEVLIPESVTSLGMRAFTGCKGLKRVEIPQNVTEIGDEAFSNCALEEISFAEQPWQKILDEENKKRIFRSGYGQTKFTFREDPAIVAARIREEEKKQAEMREEEKRIAAEKRAKAEAAKKVKAEKTAEREAHPFEIKDGVLVKYVGPSGKVVIPDDVTEIASRAFYRSKRRLEVAIPGSVKKIGDEAFSCCEYLQSVEIVGSGATEIGKSAFYLCEWELKSVTLHEGVTVIGEYAFGSCKELQHIAIPDSVTVLGESAFSGCKKLADVKFGRNLSKIGKAAFYGCAALQDIALPAGLTEIGESAFKGTRVKSVVIPSSVTQIGDGAFDDPWLLRVTIPKRFKGFMGAGFKRIFGDNYKRIQFILT